MSRLTRFSVSRPDLSSRNASVELRWPMEHGNPIRRLVFGHYFLFYSYTGRHECSRKNLERTIGMSSFAGHTKYRVAQSRLAAQIKVGENRNSSCEFSGGCGDNMRRQHWETSRVSDQLPTSFTYWKASRNLWILFVKRERFRKKKSVCIPFLAERNRVERYQIRPAIKRQRHSAFGGNFRPPSSQWLTWLIDQSIKLRSNHWWWRHRGPASYQHLSWYEKKN